MATGTRAAAKTESTETHRESLGDYPLEEKIRQRAHEIWLQRAGGVGSDVTDWLQAEAEILNEMEDEGRIPASDRRQG